MKKASITYDSKTDTYSYYDKNGAQLQDGDIIRWDDGKLEQVVLGDSGQLGVDATNPAWIKSGRAVPFQFGLYPLESQWMAEIEKFEG